MVSPYFILGIGLGLAFLLGLFGKKLNKLNLVLIALALVSFVGISGMWLYQFVFGQAEQTMFYSAGFEPPFSIALQVGMQEAVIAFMVNIIALMSVIFMWRSINNGQHRLGPVLLVLFMGLNLLIFTRDIFNIFVFLEITAIAMGGLILLDEREHSASAGFKYLLASSLISSLYLLGAILVYFFTGSLYINDFAVLGADAGPVAVIAVFVALIAIVFELKPFPANGWALDVYQGASPAVGAIVSAAVATTMLFVLHKLMVLSTPFMSEMFVLIGLLTFMFSNLSGMSQKDANRLLGYSSVGQVGLIVSIIGMQNYLDDQFVFIAMGILLTHFLAKAGLFWISGIIGKSELVSFAVLRKKPILLTLFGVFIFALLAFPPFPSFFAKWELIMSLSDGGNYALIAMILLGSFFEVVYLMRWFGIVVKEPVEESILQLKVKWNQVLPPVLFAAALLFTGYFAIDFMKYPQYINYIPLIAVVALFILDFLPVWIKNTLLIGAVGYYGYIILPQLDDIPFIFGVIFLLGAVLTLLYGYYYKGKRIGFYPLAAMMFAGLILLVEADNLLAFFFAWEIMTAGSYFLILRGKKSQPHALSYMLFSFAGALLILAGFALAHSATGSWTFDALELNVSYAPLIFIMLTVGFLTKTAAIGLHIWLPGAHSEAESDVSPMVSAILLKAGVFGLMILFMRMGQQYLFGIDLMVVLSWIAVVTAIGGYLMASIQEDIKRLLAYSSVGQLGVILFGLTLMSNLGWLLAMAGVITHFLNKTLLFQSAGAVYSRTHDRMMYKMGGLIHRMPITFIFVLIGIISMSGVPPLAGFAGKWLSFNAVLQKGYYLQGVAMVIAGAVAFLYLFRIIHVPFLGQLKDHLRRVKEANFWMLLPQIFIVLIIMAFSAFPGILLEPIGSALNSIFPHGGLVWKESFLPFGARTAISEYGYWNGTYVMIISMGIFAILLGIQALIQRKNKKVGQFNIVYSGERPSTPETTHHGYNFYAHYQKAIGFLITPLATRFWNYMSDFVLSLSHHIRLIYNGNGQTYLIHIVAYFLICFFSFNGGF